MKVALTIAGSDPSGGAGIQADLKTFHAHGVYGVSAITAITVQNTVKVFKVQEVKPQIVHDQITCLFEDMTIYAVKIGMVSSIRLIEAIADAMGKVDLPPVVLDPVMVSKSGYNLLSPEAKTALVKQLIPLSHVVTPNIDEAVSLVGEPITSIDDMKSAARGMIALGAKNAVVKGGHLNGTHAIDVAYDGSEYKQFEGKRIDTANTHGTGCTFSSAIAANLAYDMAFFDAVASAKTYVSDAIQHALSIGKGHGPMHHFYQRDERGD